MTKTTFHSSAQDPDIAKYDGMACEVLSKLGPDQVDEEVGDMFNVRFDDGHELHVFADELEWSGDMLSHELESRS